ncbi:MAG: elongation factor G-like protein EF-G2 [Candidatus Nanopelagicales bacterium]
MADKRSDRKSVPAPAAPSPDRIRNVALVGPAGSGKTSLMESLLHAAGAIGRRGSVTEGTSVGDWDPVAVRQKRSVGMSVATFAWGDVVINLVDTPGYADFTGDLRAGLRGVDAALFVVSSVDGVDGATARLWDECEVVGMPRAVVVTNLDKERADFDETVAVCQRVFTGGGGVLPLFLPVHGDDGVVAGFIDLLDEQIWDWSSGQAVVTAAEDRHRELIETERGSLIEGVVTESEDEDLMDRFIGGEHVEVDQLTADLERAVARGHFHPVMGHAIRTANVGSELILDLIVRGFPSPAEHELPVVTRIDGSPTEPLSADADGPLVAEVIKTTSDPYVGKVSIVRVFSGTLRPETLVHVSGHFRPGTGHEDHDLDERIGHLTGMVGAAHSDVSAAVAGSIVAVSKLGRAETGDTLSAADHPLLMEPWQMPAPLLPVAITPHSAGDEDKLGTALARVVAEDPTLRIDHPEETGQIVLWTLGEAHADLVLDRIRTRYGVAVDAIEVRAPMRETFAAASTGNGRLVKQSGGHGQYAVVDIMVEPLAPGAGFEFVDKIVGGAVPRNFIPSVEKGIRHQMALGVAAGYPVVDIKVTLVDGKFHTVDSSDMAFQTAGAMALKDAAARTTISLLEPVITLTVDVPDEHVGAVIADVSTRRGMIKGTTSLADGRSRVVADVPETEISRYAIDIRSITHGTGDFERAEAGYAPVPAAVAKRVIEAASA